MPAASHQCLPGQLSHKGGIHPLHGHWASQRHIYNTDIPATLWMCLRDVTADVAREVAPNVTSDITLDVAPMVGAKDFSPNRCIDRKRLGMAAGRSSPGMGRSSKALQVIGHHNVTKIIASFSLNIPTVIPAKKVGIQS